MQFIFQFHISASRSCVHLRVRAHIKNAVSIAVYYFVNCFILKRGGFFSCFLCLTFWQFDVIARAQNRADALLDTVSDVQSQSLLHGAHRSQPFAERRVWRETDVRRRQRETILR